MIETNIYEIDEEEGNTHAESYDEWLHDLWPEEFECWNDEYDIIDEE